MNSIISVLEGLERLAYKILMWVILIPRTITTIILHPSFAYDYVGKELKTDRESPFDEYMSPMLLYLGITLLPALALSLLPEFGSQTPIITESAGDGQRTLRFESKVTFKSNTYSLGHELNGKSGLAEMRTNWESATTINLSLQKSIIRSAEFMSWIWTQASTFQRARARIFGPWPVTQSAIR